MYFIKNELNFAHGILICFFYFSFNTEHEYSPVCNDHVNISSTPDTPDLSGEQVDDAHNSISEQDSGEDNAQEDTSAEEVVDIASNIGSQGHVKNMIAMFSPPHR